MVRSVKIRAPRKGCIACGEGSSLTDHLDQMKYDSFCAGPSIGPELREDTKAGRIEVKVWLKWDVTPDEEQALAEILARPKEGNEVVLIDTRPEVEFGICALPNSISRSQPLLPLSSLLIYLKISPFPIYYLITQHYRRQTIWSLSVDEVRTRNSLRQCCIKREGNRCEM